MKGYSWIKPGVKAKIVPVEGDNERDSRLHGEVVTINSYLIKEGRKSYVEVEECKHLSKLLEIEICGIEASCLEPLDDDQRDEDTSTWEAIKDIIGVDIRQPEEVV